MLVFLGRRYRTYHDVEDDTRSTPGSMREKLSEMLIVRGDNPHERAAFLSLSAF